MAAALDILFAQRLSAPNYPEALAFLAATLRGE